MMMMIRYMAFGLRRANMLG